MFDPDTLDIDAIEAGIAAAQERHRLARVKAESEASLMGFVRHFWHVLEPGRALVEGWVLEAICDHLEAVTDGRILRLLINVPPGSMKSMLVNVFWPAWEWGCKGMPTLRYVSAAYAGELTERDNRRCRDLIGSPDYRAIWGNAVRIDPRQDGASHFANLSKGWRDACSVYGTGTGKRGDRVICDDPHSVKTAESRPILAETIRWWREVMPTRLNDPQLSVIVVIMQRVNEGDVSGWIMSHDPNGHWTVLMVPMHYDPERHCATSIGWQDPRGLDDDTGLPLQGVGMKRDHWCDELRQRDGELFWPERFPDWTVQREMETMGPYAVAGQYEQSPTPRGGGLIRQEDWQLWEKPKFPSFDFIVVSFDGAYTEKTMNDPSAATVWGRFMLPEDRRPHFMLIHAWQKRLPMNDVVEQLARTCLGDYVSDVREPMADETRRSPTADALLIESKGPGISVGQEITRLYGRRKWRTFLITPKGDKTARLLSVQHLFAAGQIWAPDKDWAQTVIDEVCSFPKAAHDDLTDCTSQALRWLRDVNLVMTAEEADEDWTERNRYRKPRAKLYPGT